MRPRFQADADLRFEIVSGALRREPSIDFQSAQERFEDGASDAQVLEIAAIEGRIVVSHDSGTMPAHFNRFLPERGRSPGLFLIPQSVTTGEAIEELVMVWAVSEAEEWMDRVSWLPI